MKVCKLNHYNKLRYALIFVSSSLQIYSTIYRGNPWEYPSTLLFRTCLTGGRLDAETRNHQRFPFLLASGRFKGMAQPGFLGITRILILYPGHRFDFLFFPSLSKEGKCAFFLNTLRSPSTETYGEC